MRLVTPVLVVGIILAVASPSDAANTGAATLKTTGLVFEDVNGNAQRDIGEPGLPGWRIGFYRPEATGFPTLTASTDATGRFEMMIELTVDVVSKPQLLLLAEPTSVHEGYIWVTTFRSHPFTGAIPDAIVIRDFKAGDTFDVVFGKALRPGQPPPPVVAVDLVPPSAGKTEGETSGPVQAPVRPPSVGDAGLR